MQIGVINFASIFYAIVVKWLLSSLAMIARSVKSCSSISSFSIFFALSKVFSLIHFFALLIFALP